MSTYRPQSELSRFNRLDRAGEPFPVSADMLAVMATSARVFDLSGGAWDGTVMPLVNLWGFGPAGAVDEPPSDEAVRTALGHVGFGADRGAAGRSRQEGPGGHARPASIAKGYGVDAVAALLRGEGVADFIVEIGGEIYASRRAPRRPPLARRDQPAAAGLPLPTTCSASPSCATRRSRRAGTTATTSRAAGVRYSHVLDPRTGRPVTNGVVSVSVLAPDCTLADGLATAVMVMGAEAGVALLEKVEGVEGLVVVEAKDGRLVEHGTAGFRVEPVGKAEDRR